jgi:hypothetical protein
VHEGMLVVGMAYPQNGENIMYTKIINETPNCNLKI